MFIEALIFSIVIGYILKGSLKNLENVEIRGLYLIFAAFFIEFIIVMGIRNGILHRGSITFILDLAMYILLFVFTYLNRKSCFIVFMCIGFLLNALPIFLNGGAMPVSLEAVRVAGLTENVTSEGLYRLIDENTKLWFLCDIIPLTFLRNFAISIGDIIAAIGLMLFIITGMKKEKRGTETP
jgi:hypothetical protein